MQKNQLKKVVVCVVALLLLVSSAWGATQDFKGTINGNTITAGTGTLTMAAGQTLTVNSDGTIISGTFTVVAANLAITGDVTYTGNYSRVGDVVVWRLHIATTGTTASIALSTQFTATGLPASAKHSVCHAVDVTTAAFIGSAFQQGAIIFAPTWTATGSSIVLTGSYLI